MSDSQYPTIAVEDVRKGDTIQVSYEVTGVSVTRKGTVDTITYISGAVRTIFTKGSGTVYHESIQGIYNPTITLLDRPVKPLKVGKKLSTKKDAARLDSAIPGTIITGVLPITGVRMAVIRSRAGIWATTSLMLTATTAAGLPFDTVEVVYIPTDAA